MWRRMRLFAGLLIIFGLVMGTVSATHSRRLDGNTLTFYFYVPSGLLVVVAFLLNRWRQQVTVGESGLQVGRLFSTVEISYEQIRQARVQPLAEAFAAGSRKRFATNPYTRPLLSKPALFVRLRGSDEEIAALARQLGPRLVYEGTLALPVPDPGALAAAISDHLPNRGTGSNLGGSRKGRRRR